MFMITCVFYMSLLCSCGAIRGDRSAKHMESTVDEQYSDNWVDPGDMLSSDLTSFSAIYEKDEQAIETDIKNNDNVATAPHLKGGNHHRVTDVIDQRRNCDLPYLKQLTRVIIDSFQIPGKRYATIELSYDDLKILKEFKNNDMEGERISDVLDLIIGIFARIKEDERLELTLTSRIFSILEYKMDIFALVLMISVLISILLIFETRTTMPWYQQCWYLFVLFFMMSIPWEWLRLYQKKFAEKQAELIKEIPAHCAPKNMTIAERVSLWATDLVSWREDSCIKYQEAILVDPVWEVSPSVALSTTATRLLFEPLEFIANSCGKSLNAFLKHIPALWQPIMIAILTVIMLLCVFLLMRYRVKFGFFEIGPAVTQTRRLEREDIDDLRNCIHLEIAKVIRREVAPVKQGNLEELPKIKAAVQEERADGHYISRGIRETGSPVYDLPVTQNVTA